MLDCRNTALIVIDFQDNLLTQIFNAKTIVPQAIRLIQFAKIMNMPLVVTEQYPKGLGHTTQIVAAELGGIKALAKTSFGCWGDAGFVEAVTALDRTQLLVTGIETHVCVMQTVLATSQTGHEAFVVQDAVGSRRASDHAAGLARMDKAGANLVTAEMAMFELLGDAATPEFKKVLPLLK